MSGLDRSPWLRRALEQERQRRETRDPRDVMKALRSIIAPLTRGERARCSRSAPSWLHIKRDKRERTRVEITFSTQADGGSGDHPALRLKSLPELDDGALLTIFVQLRDKRLDKYNIGLAGTLRDGGAPWFVRVDLDPPLLAPDIDLGQPESDLLAQIIRRPENSRLGAGLATHAWPHCHVGRDPSDGAQETRVPVPFLMPQDALAWVLAIADPALEPCPWEDPPE